MQQAPLAPPPSLEDLQSEALLSVFLDFDGTLLEIAPTHDSIEVPESLPRALEALSASLSGRFAIVSGRSLDDLASHLGTLEVTQSGSHGAESRLANGERVGSEPPTLFREVIADLEQLVAATPGASLESKKHGAAIHFRARPEIEDEIATAASAIAEKHQLATKRGKCVVELLADSASKADAVRALMARAPFAGSRPVFLGDDLTDEDGFSAVKEFGGSGIQVGGSRKTEACYRLASPRDVRRWLGLGIE